VELLKGEQLEHIQDKFFEFSSHNIRNLVVFFKHHSRGDYIDIILELKSKSRYDYIQECCFPRQVHGQKGVHFQNVDKSCQEWSQPYHMNATYKGFAKHVDHV
jgi:hypothetical protein